MDIFIENLENFKKISRKCDIDCDFKTLYIVKLSSYIKEQLKFASFLGVEGRAGGRPKQPSEVSNIYLLRQKSMFF